MENTACCCQVWEEVRWAKVVSKPQGFQKHVLSVNEVLPLWLARAVGKSIGSGNWKLG